MDAPDSGALRWPTTESWQVNRLSTSARSNKASGIQPIAQGEQGIPKPVSGLNAMSSRVRVGNTTYAQVQINHRIASSDSAFSHANIWISGLNGNSNPQLQSASPASPHTFLLPSTGEAVSVTVQSVGKDGSLLPLSLSPSTPVQL